MLAADGIYIVEDVVLGSWISTNLDSLRAMFPGTHMFLVGRQSNQLVVTYK